MAVTVTKAAPSTSLRRSYAGAYGPSGPSSNFNNVGNTAIANKRIRCTKLTLSGTYATGGFALTPSDYGLKEIHEIFVCCDTNSSNGAGAVIRLTTTGSSPNVKLYSDTSTELANTTSVANFVYTVWVVGV